MDDLQGLTGSIRALAPGQTTTIRLYDEKNDSSRSILGAVKKAYVHRPKSSLNLNAGLRDRSPGTNPIATADARQAMLAACIAAGKMRHTWRSLSKLHRNGSALDPGKEPDLLTREVSRNECSSDLATCIGGAQAGGATSEPPVVPLPYEGSQKRKHSGDHGDTSRCKPKSESGIEAASQGAHYKPFTPENLKNRDILDWMDDQPETAELVRCNAFSSQQVAAAPQEGSTRVVQFNAGHEATQSLEYLGINSLHAGTMSSPLHGDLRAVNHDLRTPVFQGDLQDDSSALDRCRTFDAQHRALRGSSTALSRTTVSVPCQSPSPNGRPIDQFPAPRRGSAATVTTTSGTISDSSSTKRWSASTALSASTTITLPEALQAQIKRIHRDSRASSFFSRSASSRRSSVSNAEPLPHRTPSWRSQDLPPGDHAGKYPPVPALPPNLDSVPGGAFLDNLGASLEVDQVLKAGHLAQEQRWTPLAARGIDPRMRLESLAFRESLPCPASKPGLAGLSIISENASEAGSFGPRSPTSAVDGASVRKGVIVDAQDTEGLCIWDTTELQLSETPSIVSCDATLLKSETSATSFVDLVESERQSSDSSDSDETVSDVTDYTDISLLEAFDSSPTPFTPVLLFVLFRFKEDVRQRLRTIYQSHGGKQHQAAGCGSSSFISGSYTERAEGSSSRNETGSRKRARSGGDDGDSAGRRGDDDGEKRQKPSSTPKTQLEMRLRRFACPFHKRYPGKKWSRSCNGPGWDTVHRVKEHIFRRHKANFKCLRCHEIFADLETRQAHVSATPACAPRSMPQESSCISEWQEQELRKRLKDISPEERWYKMYSIIFPDHEVSSPYHDVDLQNPLPNPAIIDTFRGFLQQHLRPRIIADFSNYLPTSSLEGFPAPEEMSEIVYATVGECLDKFLSDLHSLQAAELPAVVGAALERNHEYQDLGLDSERDVEPGPGRIVEQPTDAVQGSIDNIEADRYLAARSVGGFVDPPSTATFEYCLFTQFSQLNSTGQHRRIAPLQDDSTWGLPTFGGELDFDPAAFASPDTESQLPLGLEWATGPSQFGI